MNRHRHGDTSESVVPLKLRTRKHILPLATPQTFFFELFQTRVALCVPFVCFKPSHTLRVSHRSFSLVSIIATHLPDRSPQSLQSTPCWKCDMATETFRTNSAALKNIPWRTDVVCTAGGLQTLEGVDSLSVRQLCVITIF